MTAKREFSSEEAKHIGDQLEIDWKKVDLEQFRIGLIIELEHGGVDPKTNVTNDDFVLTGKIALAHQNDFLHVRPSSKFSASASRCFSGCNSRIFIQMRQGDLAGQNKIIVSDIRLGSTPPCSSSMIRPIRNCSRSTFFQSISAGRRYVSLPRC